MSTVPLIDDEPAIREILRDHLDMEEYDVRTDRDGESGLEPNFAAIVCEARAGSVQRSARGYSDERVGQYTHQRIGPGRPGRARSRGARRAVAARESRRRRRTPARAAHARLTARTGQRIRALRWVADSSTTLNAE